MKYNTKLQHGKGLFALFLLFSFASCNLDNFDFDKLSDKTDISPEFKVPLAHGKYTIWDLITSQDVDDDMIKVNDDGVITFTYLENDVFSFSNEEFVEFPNSIALDQIQKNLDVVTGIIGNGHYTITSGIKETFSESTTVEFDEGVTIYKVSTSQGYLNASVELQGFSNVNGKFIIEFDGLLDKHGNPMKLEDDLSDAETLKSLYLTDCSIVLGGDHSDQLKATYTIQIDEGVKVDLSTNQSVTIDLEFKELEFSQIQGDFGAQTIDIEGGNTEFDLDIDFLKDFDGTFEFGDPTIALKYKNGFAIPITINGKIDGHYTDGTSTKMDIDPLVIKPAVFEGADLTPIEDKVVINKDNSNIVDFLSDIPDESIEFSGMITINDGEEVVSKENPNVMENDSEAVMDLEFSIPLELQAENLSMTDTIKIDKQDTDSFEEMTLWVDYKNGTEINLELEIWFVDTLTGARINNMLPINVGEMQYATVVDETKQPSKGALSVALTEDNIENLSEATGIVLSSSINSLENGTEYSTISASDSLSIFLSFDVKVDGSEL